MPVLNIFNLGEECLWGIWKIEEDESTLQSKILATGYTEGQPIITHQKKRIEWLSSRLLIHSLLEKFGKPFYGIVNDFYGKPHLRNYSDYHVSLSHCNDYSVAILHKSTQVGIDIELLKDKLRLVTRKFLSEDEISQVVGDDKKLCVYWCVKEVVYKLHGTKVISLKNNIFIHPFDFKLSGGKCKADLIFENKKTSFQLTYLCINNYFIAFNH